MLPFFLFLNHSAKAQRFMPGITFGPAATTVNGIDNKDFDNDAFKIGFTLGAFVNTHLNDKNILQFEMNFMQKGASQAPDSNNNHSFKLRLNYLDAGVLIRHRISFKLSGKLINNIDLEIGASAGRLLSASYILNTYPQPLTSDDFNYTDINAFVGIDYNFSPNVYFCVRYSNSLDPVLVRNPVVYYPSAYTWNRGNNEVFDFTLRIVFGKRVAVNSNSNP